MSVCKYINPFTDFGFKKLFGEEANKDLLIDFLNEILQDNHKIKNLSYKPTEHFPRHETDRKAIFDLYCENEKGEKFIIELQKAKQDFFKERSIYYTTFPIQEQAKKGEWDYNLVAVYTIGILDFRFEDEDKDKVLVKVQLKDQDNKVFYTKLHFVYLQLVNFQKKEEELKNHYEKWLYLLRNLGKFEKIPEKFKHKIFKKLFSVAEISKLSQAEYEVYLDSLKSYNDLRNSLNTSKKEGEQIGFVKGEKIGTEKGILIGLEKGEKIGIEKEKIEIAKNLKKLGTPIEIIIQATQLSKQEIDKL